MKSIHVALAVLMSAVTSFGQGQVNFANKVGLAIDSPVFMPGTQQGPGPGYSAQLNLMEANGALTPLTPISTFMAAGSGPEVITDRYWESKIVDVPVTPGASATFVVRAWLTAFGSYEAARSAGEIYVGASDPFRVTVGGGGLPPADLTTLKSFTFGLPEPSVITVGLLGGAALVMFGRTSKSRSLPDSSNQEI